MTTIWKKRPNTVALDENRIQDIAKECDLYPILVRSFLNRGYTAEELIALTNAPETMIPTEPLAGSIQAAQKILEHLKRNSNIYVFADYDCDGVTSGFVMTDGIRKIRNAIGSVSKVMLHYPERVEGYGLSMAFCERTAAIADLVITVDNGITKRNEVQFLKTHNCDTIITDHHEVVEGLVPDAIICNPCYNDIARKHLAGVGVAWNVVKQLNILSMAKIDHNKYLSAVALGTVADVMELTAENMALVNIGLQQINTGTGIPFLSIYKEYTTRNNFVAKDLGWNLGPKINSTGRMGNVWLSAAGFFVEDKDTIMDFLVGINDTQKKRKKITDKFKKEFKSVDLLDARIVAYDASEYIKGVHGILAGELSKIFPQYPSFVYSEKDGLLHGSFRCKADIDLISMFNKQKEKGTLISVAGHKKACVATLKKEKLDDFINSFSDDYDAMDLKIEDVVYYDNVISLGMADNKMLENLNRLPTNNDTQPVFVLTNALVINTKLSKSNADNICFKLSDTTASKEVWAFGFAERYRQLGSPKQLHVLCTVEQDFRRADVPSSAISVIDILPAQTA